MPYTKTLLLSYLLAATAILHAEPGSIKKEDQIKYRQSAMMFLRWNMSKLKQQVDADANQFNSAEALNAAHAIAGVAHSDLHTLFSSDSASGTGWQPTRVKPTYFQNAEDVQKKYNAFMQQADNLVASARLGEQARLKQPFHELLDACKGCHKHYRTK